MMADKGFCYRRGRLLAERLEAGEPVVLDCATVELALWLRGRAPERVRLPFERGARRVRVSPDDRVVAQADSSVVGRVRALRRSTSSMGCDRVG
jgi:hypothetical protein